jgi:hypothetical protein
MEIDYRLFAEMAKNYDYQYEVEDLYGNMIVKKLDKEFNLYFRFDESTNTFYCDAIDFKISMRDVKSYDELHDLIKDKIGDDNEDALLKNKFKYFMDYIKVESKIGEIKDYSSYSFDTMGFFDLLWYLKTDKFLRDGSKGHELMNVAQDYADKYPNDNATYFYPRSGLQYQIRYGSWIDMTTVDAKFSGWMVKFFKNGKIQIKGMSDEDWNKIVYIYDICKRK